MSGRETLYFIDLPPTEYLRALALQREIVSARKDGRIESDVALLLEHPPVFTLGRNGRRDNLVVSEAFLAEKGVSVIPCERGGDITFHGPGQLVAYPILSMEANGLGAREYVAGLEAVMCATAADWAIRASGDEKNRGVWVSGRKLGSIGIAVTRSISFHGLALNVNLSLEPFTWINPCGLTGVRMTSMAAELATAAPAPDSHSTTVPELTMAAARHRLKGHLANFLKKEFMQIDLETLTEQMRRA